MTNGVWFKNKRELEGALHRLKDADYDGEICVSVDAFHAQSLNKLKIFIDSVSKIFDRKNMVSIAYVAGARDAKTKKKLKKVLKWLPPFAKIIKIDLSPIGKAKVLKNPWDGKWFKEDHCKGPGNIFFVTPDGSVKPCCGYANEADELTIGNISRDTADKLLKNFKNNRFAFTIFNSGLSAIRKRLEAEGYKFPGKTSNHCYFCYYIIENVPRKLLNACLG